MKFDKAPLSELQRLRSYSRRINEKRESWDEACDRVLYSPHLGLKVLGKFSDEEMALIDEMQRQRKAFGSARWLWVGGTQWVEKLENMSGAYNCTSQRITSFERMAEMMNLAMMGSGTGAVLELDCIEQLPTIVNKLNIQTIGKPGDFEQRDNTTVWHTEGMLEDENENPVTIVQITVGDSRKGWVDAYLQLLKLAADEDMTRQIDVMVYLSHVRPAGSTLKGFGGVANPIKLADMFPRMAQILNGAVGRKLNSVEACLLIDEAALVVVAGNVRRSAGMRQFSADDELAATAKDNLWQEDEEGNWRIDPKRDALRMANHTRVFHRKPTQQEILEAVTKQFYSGEGAIQYAPEAIARANADLLDDEVKRKQFLVEYEISPESAGKYLSRLALGKITSEELQHRLQRYGLNPCGEILGSDFHCNLASVHLNQIDPFDFEGQEKAFKASALQAAAFLQRNFVNPIHLQSRDLDPIVGVSFTGLVTFFVKAFGVDWLRWWEAGRPDEWEVEDTSRIADIANCFPDWYGYRFGEKHGVMLKDLECRYLEHWKTIVNETVWEYCDRHNLKRPNRCTTLKPEGSLTLLTGVGCNGHHMPKGWTYIRRMTFAAHDPIALAAMDYGYTVIPSQSDKDENGNLLNDPFDPRCTEWLVEIPVMEEAAQLFPEVADIDPGKFSALAQFDFCMQVQRHYVSHNLSATIELRENEIEPLAQRIYQAIQNDEGYISAALLARFDDVQTYPRLPFEPISRERYDELIAEVLNRRQSDDFQSLIDKHDRGEEIEPQDAACSSGACEIRQAGIVPELVKG